MARTTYTITIVPTTDGDHYPDLRALLKVMLRRFRFRCVKIEPKRPEDNT